MNIQDYQAPAFTPNWLEHIFDKQTDLIKKYAEIEGMPEWPMSVNSRVGQKWIKDFLWRVTEELGESYEAYHLLTTSTNVTDEDAELHRMHRIEELSDSLHFLVELLILVGKDWQWARTQLDTMQPEVQLWDTAPGLTYWQVSYYLSMVGNTLKNKPWKQTDILTDIPKFELNLGLAFKALFVCFEAAGADEKVVFDYYCRKNQVNQFRQRSQY